jgi:hypothetical protein
MRHAVARRHYQQNGSATQPATAGPIYAMTAIGYSTNAIALFTDTFALECELATSRQKIERFTNRIDSYGEITPLYLTCDGIKHSFVLTDHRHHQKTKSRQYLRIFGFRHKRDSLCACTLNCRERVKIKVFNMVTADWSERGTK